MYSVRLAQLTPIVFGTTAEDAAQRAEALRPAAESDARLSCSSKGAPAMEVMRADKGAALTPSPSPSGASSVAGSQSLSRPSQVASAAEGLPVGPAWTAPPSPTQ